MKKTIITYLISIIILTILGLLFHLNNWPGTNVIVLLGILILMIIAVISIIRSKRKGKAILFGIIVIPFFIFTSGLSLNMLNIRYSIWPFGEPFPSSIKVGDSSQAWYNQTSNEKLSEKIENGIIGIEDQWFTKSLIVIVNDELVIEKYFNGVKPTEAFHLQSATKSVISALIGIAIDKGLIQSVDQKLSGVFPEYFENKTNTEKDKITIRNLLTMQAGIDNNNRTGLNWTSSIINSPLKYEVDEKFCYSDSQSQLLASILSKRSKMSVYEFAKINLFNRIHTSIGYWLESPEGINLGSHGLYLTPRCMAKFGLLYLKEGQIDRNQIISKEWINASLQDYSSGKGRCDQIQFDSYGYQWWKKNIADMEAFSAVGWGGQLIMIVPEIDVVIVNVNEPNVSGYDCGVNTDMSLSYIENVLKIIKNAKTISS